MRKVSIIPTLFTLSNLICGLGTLWFAAKALVLLQGAQPEGWVESYNEALRVAAWLIFIGMVFDVLDGKIARLTNSTSQFGKELDSLADFLSFGIAPAFLIEVVSINDKALLFVIGDKGRMILSAAFAVFAALRLAKYNVTASAKNEEATKDFIGLPSPAAAGVIAASVLVGVKMSAQASFITDFLRHWTPLLAAFLGLLMVSSIRFPHFGNRFIGSTLSFKRVVIAAATVLLLFMFPAVLLAFLFSTYVAVGIASHFKKRGGTDAAGCIQGEAEQE